MQFALTYWSLVMHRRLCTSACHRILGSLNKGKGISRNCYTMHTFPNLFHIHLHCVSETEILCRIVAWIIISPRRLGSLDNFLERSDQSFMFFIFKFLLLLIYVTILIHIPSKLAVSRCLILVNYLLIRFCNTACFLNFFQLTTTGTCAFLIGKVFVYSVSILYILLVFWWSDYVRISLHDICRIIIFIWDAIWTYFLIKLCLYERNSCLQL